MDSGLFQVNQRLEIYLAKSRQGDVFYSRIEEITPTHMIIAMPMEKGQPLVVNSGAPVYGRLLTETAPYLFKSFFIDRRMSPRPVWLMSLPSEIQKVQLREFVRISSKLPVVVKVETLPAVLQPAGLFIRDISGGGLQILSKQPFPSRAKVSLHFELPEVGPIEAKGEVTRMQQPKSDPTSYWVGVKFIDLAEKERSKIIKYIFKLELERRRKGLL